MYQTKKTFIKPDMKMADLIYENPSLLLMMEHFDFNIVVRDLTVAEISEENQINPAVFIAVANMYNGFNSQHSERFDESDIKPIIRFLENSHRYYLEEKIPDISNNINDLYSENDTSEIGLIESFFKEYSKEVKEHLQYEDKVAFPYFNKLVQNSEAGKTQEKFSSQEYREHHTDIETKLADLKKLLLKYIPSKGACSVRRKLLINLFELEADLNIHSEIEESILIPLIKRIEKQYNLG